MDDNKSEDINDSGNIKLPEDNDSAPAIDVMSPKKDTTVEGSDSAPNTVDNSISEDSITVRTTGSEKVEGYKEIDPDSGNGEINPSLDNLPDQAKLQEDNDISPVNSNLIEPTKQKQGHKKPIGVIVIAAIVAIGLIGLSVYMYINSQPKPIDNSADTTDQTEEKKEEATPEAVDETTKEIDDNMDGLDDNADFSESELSDDTLGL